MKTESLVLEMLHKKFKKDIVRITNVYYFKGWESDFLVFDKNKIHEYEIKLSKNDFYQDKYKVEKHEALQKGEGPNTFTYVTTADVPIEIVPAVAGLIHWSDAGLKTIRVANLLHHKPTGVYGNEKLFDLLYVNWRRATEKLNKIEIDKL
jgi:hypothetical protein